MVIPSTFSSVEILIIYMFIMKLKVLILEPECHKTTFIRILYRIVIIELFCQDFKVVWEIAYDLTNVFIGRVEGVVIDIVANFRYVCK